MRKRQKSGQKGSFSLPFCFFCVMERSEDIIMGETLFPNCPVRNIFARVGDKWSLLLMHQLLHHTEAMRFSELQKAIPDISQKVLTTTLRTLEADGFVVRTVYPEVPPRTEYSLTPRALSFMEACRPMVKWAIDNFGDIMRDRAKNGTKM